MDKNTVVFMNRSHARDLLFLILFVCIVLFYLALGSYTPLDPAPNSAHFPPVTPQNYIGLWGAYISASLVYTLGLGSYLVPIPIFLIWILYLKRRISWQKITLLFASTGLLYMSSIYMLSIFKPTLTLFNIEISTLGTLGLAVLENFYLRLGKVGGPIISGFLGLFSILIFTGFDLLSIKNKIFKIFTHRFQRE
jgi:hypothetical protein